MIQLNVDMAQIASSLGAPVASDAGAGSFPDLLGLLLKGKLAGLPLASQGAWTMAADQASSPSLTPMVVDDAAGGLLAQKGDMDEAPWTQLLALLLNPGATPRGGSGEAALRGQGVENVATSQKKLPTLPAGIAGLQAQEAADAPSGKVVLDFLKSLQAKPELYFQGGQPLSLTELKQALDAFAATSGRTPLLPPGIPTQDSLAQVHLPLASVPLAREADPGLAVPRLAAQMSAPFASPEWRTEVGERIAWMVGRHAQVAELILNPPNLGTIEVHLKMNSSGNEAGAQFFANNPAVREALENAVPRLRELMAEAGITLGDASVSQHSNPRGETEARGNGPSGQGEEGLIHADETLSGVIQGHGRLSARVDVYI